jgi:hypothetical protein
MDHRHVRGKHAVHDEFIFIAGNPAIIGFRP